MSLTHDIIKMKYIEEGYLPNYPFHMISDAEMCDAFLKANPTGSQPGLYEADDTALSYFLDTYPCNWSSDATISASYAKLIDSILWHIEQLKASKSPEYQLPSWVYSYMLGAVIGPNSEVLDIHDMLVLMGIDNVDDVLTTEGARKCLNISTKWVSKLPSQELAHRPPTIFGEPHVIKYLRLVQSSDRGM